MEERAELGDAGRKGGPGGGKETEQGCKGGGRGSEDGAEKKGAFEGREELLGEVERATLERLKGREQLLEGKLAWTADPGRHGGVEHRTWEGGEGEVEWKGEERSKEGHLQVQGVEWGEAWVWGWEDDFSKSEEAWKQGGPWIKNGWTQEEG